LTTSVGGDPASPDPEAETGPGLLARLYASEVER
jgi:hypothetical protein